jgi:hypothetical protein
VGNKVPFVEVRSLSSRLTFVIKFLLPPFMFFALGFMTCMSWGQYMVGSPNRLPAAFIWVFTVVWVATTWMLWRWGVPVKHVQLIDSNLRVSNYLRHFDVPLSAIKRISENRWINSNPVTLEFDRHTLFGDSIMFMPKWRMYPMASPHSVLAELEQAIAQARLRDRLGRQECGPRVANPSLHGERVG